LVYQLSSSMTAAMRMGYERQGNAAENITLGEMQ